VSPHQLKSQGKEVATPKDKGVSHFRNNNANCGVFRPRHLPPRTGLRAFKAAGRLLSFTAAAAELTFAQAAISHQIKALEEHLGLPLFVRLPRKLELTKAGKVLLPVVRESFYRICNAVAELT